MKKTLMIAVAAMCFSAPAFAMDDMHMDADMMMKHKMDMMDTNEDGLVSKTEMSAFSDMMFTKADVNKDGMVSEEEMMAVHKMEMEEMMDDSMDEKDMMDK